MRVPRRFVETEIEECLRARTEQLAHFRDLGPPDLVHYRRSNGSKEVLYSRPFLQVVKKLMGSKRLELITMLRGSMARRLLLSQPISRTYDMRFRDYGLFNRAPSGLLSICCKQTDN